MPETLLSPSNVLLFGRVVTDLRVDQQVHPGPGPVPVPAGATGRVPAGGPGAPAPIYRHTPFTQERVGPNRDLENQLADAGACFARIYGFSYEGTYYDLARPALFLVHGTGVPVTEAFPGVGAPARARAPGEPSLTGLAAADFQFVDDLMVWSYDKFDYTIRLDVETGMYEDVLLGTSLGSGGPGASGARVSGARVSGARVSGARVSGARLSGGRGDAGD
jgi:hypothetical protein